jgi:hypothetical protein
MVDPLLLSFLPSLTSLPALHALRKFDEEKEGTLYPVVPGSERICHEAADFGDEVITGLFERPRPAGSEANFTLPSRTFAGVRS